MAPSAGRLLELNRRLLELEHELSVARVKLRLLRGTLATFPALVVVIYVISVLPEPGFKIDYIVVPLVVTAGLCLTVCLRLLYERAGETQSGHWRDPRLVELDLTVERERKAVELAAIGPDSTVRQHSYREAIGGELESQRAAAQYYRRISNALQSVIIVGSLAATSITSLALNAVALRWVSVGVTFLVGLAAGFAGFFKFKDRSFYLQQTADSIEHEWMSFELGIGRYKGLGADSALAELVEEVERLRSEQRKREQNIDQPPERADS